MAKNSSEADVKPSDYHWTALIILSFRYSPSRVYFCRQIASLLSLLSLINQNSFIHSYSCKTSCQTATKHNVC